MISSRSCFVSSGMTIMFIFFNVSKTKQKIRRKKIRKSPTRWYLPTVCVNIETSFLVFYWSEQTKRSFKTLVKLIQLIFVSSRICYTHQCQRGACIRWNIMLFGNCKSFPDRLIKIIDFKLLAAYRCVGLESHIRLHLFFHLRKFLPVYLLNVLLLDILKVSI
jgi:hypothetical protein